MAKVIFLAGAPNSDTLTWDETSLLQQFQPPARRFLGEDVDTFTPASSTIVAVPKWRIVPGTASMDANAPLLVPESSLVPPAQYRTFDDKPDATQRAIDARLDFLEHSLVMLTAREETEHDITATTAGTLLSFTTDSDITHTSCISSSPPSLVHPSPPLPRLTSPLTNLISIPSASRLRLLHPQTLTIDFLGAVIRVESPRTVTLRRNRQVEKELLQVLLGDETCSNFSVTFWFSIDTSRDSAGRKESSTPATLRARLLALTPGSVVLMRNIALSEWNGTVYGCSLLGKGFAARGSSSTVTVVRDEEGSWGGTAQTGATLAKLDRVRGWRDSFVGRGRGNGEVEGVGTDGLPVDDTQIGP